MMSHGPVLPMKRHWRWHHSSYTTLCINQTRILNHIMYLNGTKPKRTLYFFTKKLSKPHNKQLPKLWLRAIDKRIPNNRIDAFFVADRCLYTKEHPID